MCQFDTAIGIMLTMKIIPETKVRKLSVWFIIGLPILIFVGTLFANFYYDVPPGGTILKDILIRPLVGVFSLTGIALGVASLILGLIAVIKKKERAILVFIPIILGFLLVFLLLGEVFPGQH